MYIVSILQKGYFLWSIPFVFFACKSKPAAINNVADPKNCEWYIIQDDKTPTSNSNKLDVYALRMYPNGTYTLCADLLFEQGAWRFDEDKKLLILSSLEKDSFQDERYIADQLSARNQTQFSFYHQYPPDKEKPDEVIEVRSISNQSTYDPYNPSMNLWRKKPASLESPEQIRKRVAGYLQFLKALYYHERDNGLLNAGGTWYPQPIRFYSNKVSMAYADKLNDWYNCFYNDQQGIEGYKLISAALMRTTIKGEDDNSRNIDCVEQLLLQLPK